MPLDVLDVQALRRWVITARATLSEHAGLINSLNVFPVPDRDTGTNMSVTMNLAVDGLATEAPVDLLTSVQVLARATVVSARGNSGVILSQLARGLADVVIALDGAPLRSPDLADVLREAASRARSGVRAPVEGTMLSVADAAADAARSAADLPLADLVDRVVDAARDAVALTRDQLPVLREAGVVDAGAVGYWLVLRSLQRVVHQDSGAVSEDENPSWLRAPERECPTSATGAAGASHVAGGPSHELMFVLHDSDEDRVAVLASVLESFGDSVVIAGGPELCSVHVHLDDPAAGINAAVAAGRPDRFALTRFADHADEGALPTVESETAPHPRSPILALLASPGLADLVRGADADIQVLIEPDEQAVADALSGPVCRVVVADTEPLRTMAREAARAKPGSFVCVTAHPTELLSLLAIGVGGQDCSDLGALHRECDDAVAAVSTYTVEGPHADAISACRELVEQVVTDDVELVTLVAGEEAPGGLLAELTRQLAHSHPQVEVASFDGGRLGVVLDVGCE